MKKQQSREPGMGMRAIPIILVLSVIPLISRLQPLQNVFSDLFWQNPETDWIKPDVFLFWKAICLTALATVMLALMLGGWLRGRSRTRNGRETEDRKPVWPLWFPLGFALLAGLSTALSAFPGASLKGATDQMEPLWVLLSYAVVFAFSYWMLRSEADLRLILRFFLLGMAVMAGLGVLQLLKADPLRWDWVKSLMAPGNEENLVFNFPPGRVYVTLFNPNYVGSYVAMAFPVLTALTIAARGWKKKLPFLLLGTALLLCLLGSGAKNGLIALAAALLLLVLFYRKQVFHSVKVSLAITAVAVVLVAGLEIGTGVFSSTLRGLFASASSGTALEDIQTLEDRVTITYAGEPLSLSYRVNAEGYFSMTFTDKAGQEIDYTVEVTDGRYVLADSRFANLGIQPCQIGEEIGFSLEADGSIWYFVNHPEDGGYYFSNQQDRLVKLHEVPSAVFTQMGGAFSGRGYIWSRTIPLLREAPLLGSGPDTFAAVFPQEDYVGMLNNGYGNLLITRAHNMYLQMGVQLGLPALLLFLAFYVCYLLTGMRRYGSRKPETFLEHAGIGLCAGTFGYMVSGIINDSLVVTTPIFCCLFGLGMAVNHMVKKQRAS